jgi:hypothetical protein
MPPDNDFHLSFDRTFGHNPRVAAHFSTRPHFYLEIKQLPFLPLTYPQDNAHKLGITKRLRLMNDTGDVEKIFLI